MNRPTRTTKSDTPAPKKSKLDVLDNLTHLIQQPSTFIEKQVKRNQKYKQANEAHHKKSIRDLPFHEDNIHNIKLDLREVTENILELDYRNYLSDFTQEELDYSIKRLKDKDRPLIPREIFQERQRARIETFHKAEQQAKIEEDDHILGRFQQAFEQVLTDKGYRVPLPDNIDDIAFRVDTTKKLVELRRSLDELEKKQKDYVDKVKKSEIESEIVYVPRVINEEEVREHGVVPIEDGLVPRIIVRPKSQVDVKKFSPFPEENNRPVAEPEISDDDKYYNSLDTWQQRYYKLYKDMPDATETFDVDDTRGIEKFYLDKRKIGHPDDGIEVYGDPEEYIMPNMTGERLTDAVLTNIPKGQRLLLKYQQSAIPKSYTDREHIRVLEHGPNEHDIFKWEKRDELIAPLYTIKAVRQHNDNLVQLVEDKNLNASQKLDVLSRFYQPEPELPIDLMITFKVLEPDLFNINPFKFNSNLDPEIVSSILKGEFDINSLPDSPYKDHLQALYNRDGEYGLTSILFHSPEQSFTNPSLQFQHDVKIREAINKDIKDAVISNGLNLPTLHPDVRNERLKEIREEVINKHKDLRKQLYPPDSTHKLYDEVTILSPEMLSYYYNTIGETRMNLIRETLHEEMASNPNFLKDLHQQMLQQHYRDMQRTLHGGIDPFNIPERLARFKERQERMQKEIAQHRQRKAKQLRLNRSQQIFNMKFTPRRKREEVIFANALTEIFDEQFAAAILGKKKQKTDDKKKGITHPHIPKQQLGQHIQESPFFKDFLRTTQHLYANRPTKTKTKPVDTSPSTTLSSQLKPKQQARRIDNEVPTHAYLHDLIDLTTTDDTDDRDGKKSPSQEDAFKKRLSKGYIDVENIVELQSWEKKVLSDIAQQSIMAMYKEDTDEDKISRFIDSIPSESIREDARKKFKAFQTGDERYLTPRRVLHDSSDKRHPEEIYQEELDRIAKRIADAQQKEETKFMTDVEIRRYKQRRKLRETSPAVIQKKADELERRKRESSWVLEGRHWVDRSAQVAYQQNLMKRFEERNREMREDSQRFKRELTEERETMTEDQLQAERELQRLLFPKLFAPKNVKSTYPIREVDPNTGKVFDSVKVVNRIVVDFHPFESHQRQESPKIRPITHDYLKEVIANKMHRNKLEETKSELKFIANELFDLEIGIYNQIIEDNNQYLDTLKSQQDQRIAAQRKLEEERAMGIDHLPVETFDPVKQAQQQMDGFDAMRDQYSKLLTGGPSDGRDDKKPLSDDPVLSRPLPVTNTEPIIDYDALKLPLITDPNQIQELRDQLLSRIEYGELDLAQFKRNSNYNALIVDPLREKQAEIQRRVDEERDLMLLPPGQQAAARKHLENMRNRPESSIKKHTPKVSPVVYNVLQSMHDAKIFEQRKELIDELKSLRKLSLEQQRLHKNRLQRDDLSSTLEKTTATFADDGLPIPPQLQQATQKTNEALARVLANPAMLDEFTRVPSVQSYIQQLTSTVQSLRHRHMSNAIRHTRQYQLHQQQQIEQQKRKQESEEYERLMKLYYDGEENPQRIIYDYIDGIMKYNPAANLAALLPSTPTKPTYTSSRLVTRGVNDIDTIDTTTTATDVPGAMTSKISEDQQQQKTPPESDAVTKFFQNFGNLARTWWERSQDPESIRAQKSFETTADALVRVEYLDNLYFPRSSIEKQQMLQDTARKHPHLFTLANPLVLDEICNNSGIFNHVARRELKALKDAVLDVPVDMDRHLLKDEQFNFEQLREYQVKLWERRDKLLQTVPSVTLPTFLQYRLQQLRMIYQVEDISKDRYTSRDTAYLQDEEYHKRYHAKQYKRQQKAFKLYDHFYASFSDEYKQIVEQRHQSRRQKQQQSTTSSRIPRMVQGLDDTSDTSFLSLVRNSILGTTFNRLINNTRALLNLPPVDTTLTPSITNITSSTALHHRLISPVFQNRRSVIQQFHHYQRIHDFLDRSTTIFSRNVPLSSVEHNSRHNRRTRQQRKSDRVTNWLEHYKQRIDTQWRVQFSKFTHLLPYFMSKHADVHSTSTSMSITDRSQLQHQRRTRAKRLDLSNLLLDSDDSDTDMASTAIKRQSLSLEDIPILSPELSVHHHKRTLHDRASSHRQRPSFITSRTINALVQQRYSDIQRRAMAIASSSSSSLSRQQRQDGLHTIGTSRSLLSSIYNYDTLLQRRNAIIHNTRHFSTHIRPPTEEPPPVPSTPPSQPPPTPPQEPPRRSPPTDDGDDDSKMPPPPKDPFDDQSQFERYYDTDDERGKISDPLTSRDMEVLRKFYQRRDRINRARYRERIKSQKAAEEERNSDFYYKPKQPTVVPPHVRRNWIRSRQNYRFYIADMKATRNQYRRAHSYWHVNMLQVYRSSSFAKSMLKGTRSHWLRRLDRLRRELRLISRMDRFLTKGRRKRPRIKRPYRNLLTSSGDIFHEDLKWEFDLLHGYSSTMAGKRRAQRIDRQIIYHQKKAIERREAELERLRNLTPIHERVEAITGPIHDRLKHLFSTGQMLYAGERHLNDFASDYKRIRAEERGERLWG